MVSAPPPTFKELACLWVPRLLLVFIALYFATAIFPITPFEGDEQGVINGVIAAEQHRTDFRELAYIYSIQPGSFLIIQALDTAVHAGHPMIIFGVLTALGATGFIVITSLMGARLCGCRPVWLALLLCGCQELVSAAWYANTCAMAGVVVAGALLIGTRKRGFWALFLASFLIAIGAWIRMDALLITPVFFPLAYWVYREWLIAVKVTSLVAVMAAMILIALLILSGTTPFESWTTFAEQPAGTGWHSLFHLGWLASSATMTGAFLLAAFALWCRREKILLLCALAGWLPAILVYGRVFTTTKYLYYPLPFALFLIARWLVILCEEKRQRSRVIAATMLGIIFLESVIGVRTSEPFYRRFMTGSLVPFASFHLGLLKRPIRIGLGEGEIVGTDDGFRLRTGWAFGPRVWRREKQAILPELSLIEEAIRKPKATIVTSTYLSNRVVVGALLTLQRACLARGPIVEDSGSFYSEWQSSGGRIFVVLVNNSPGEKALFKRSIERDDPVIFINDRGRNAAHYLGVDAENWTMLSTTEDALLTTYVRKAASPFPQTTDSANPH